MYERVYDLVGWGVEDAVRRLGIPAAGRQITTSVFNCSCAEQPGVVLWRQTDARVEKRRMQ